MIRAKVRRNALYVKGRETVYHDVSSSNFLENMMMCKTKQKPVGFHEGALNLRKYSVLFSVVPTNGCLRYGY